MENEWGKLGQTILRQLNKHARTKVNKLPTTKSFHPHDRKGCDDELIMKNEPSRMQFDVETKKKKTNSEKRHCEIECRSKSVIKSCKWY